MRFSSAVSYDICPSVLQNTFFSNARIVKIISCREIDEKCSVCTREFSRIALNIRTLGWCAFRPPTWWGNVGMEGISLSALETACCALIQHSATRHSRRTPINVHEGLWVKRSSLPCSHHEGIKGSRGIAPLIHNICTRWRWSVITSRPGRIAPEKESR
jgi:hypothetical protein